jgi:hypothetical protein
MFFRKLEPMRRNDSFDPVLCGAIRHETWVPEPSAPGSSSQVIRITPRGELDVHV